MTDVTFTIGFTPATGTSTMAGGPGTVAVDAGGSSASWTPTSDQPWLTITSPTVPTSGNGDVAYAVANNASGSTRQGHITVLGQTFTIDQAGV